MSEREDAKDREEVKALLKRYDTFKEAEEDINNIHADLRSGKMTPKQAMADLQFIKFRVATLPRCYNDDGDRTGLVGAPIIKT
jgi:hypothetical protein